MASLAGHVVENRFLDTLSTGPSSDLQYATPAAEDYVGQPGDGPDEDHHPDEAGRAADRPGRSSRPTSCSTSCTTETERLLREKEPAIHHLAKALIERDELIGDELEEVFAEVEAAHPKLLDKFERRVIRFRDFAPMPPVIPEAWTPPPPTPDEGETQEPAARGGVGAGPGVDPNAVPPWANRPRH